MSDWGWVSLAYGIVYATLIGYTASLVRRRRRLGGGAGR
jgi:hypothetical protein